MSYADVTNPVIIQATASMSAKIDNFVRRYAIVSNGSTTLDVGSSKVVYNSDYMDYLKVGTASEKIIKDIKGYFTFAGSKELVLIEVGNEGTTQEVAVLETFIKEGANRSYVTLCPDSWYNSNQDVNSNSIAISLPQKSITIGVGQTLSIVRPDDSKLVNWNVSNSDSAILSDNTKAKTADKKVFTAVRVGNANITLSGDYEGYETLQSFTLNVEVVSMKKNYYVLTSTPTLAQLAYDGNMTIEFPTNMPQDTRYEININGEDYLAYNSETKTFTAKQEAGVASVMITAPATDTHEVVSFSFDVSVSETNDSPTTNIILSATEEVSSGNPEQPAPLEASVTTNTMSIEQFNSSFANLLKMFVDENSARFFMCRITDGISPADDPVWQNYKNTKSFFPVYDTLATNAYTLCGAILGKMANSIFDISDTNPATPLNYKQLSGATFVELKEAFINKLTQAPVNYAYEIVGNPVILNGRYSDGVAWDYWYQWDTVCIAIEQKISTLLLNGVNNPNSVIAYNQTGIDTLEAGIVSVLEAYKNRGAISDFSKSVDVGTNQMQDVGYITAIPYAEYIVSNKEKYENEIYDGFSFYLMIGRYIRQVVINVSLA